MLLTIPDILQPDEVLQAQRLLADAPWGDGRATAGAQSARVKNNVQLPFDCVASKAIAAMVAQGLERSTTFFSAALPVRVYPPRINRYEGGSNYYGQHVDGAVRMNTQLGQHVRTDISCTVFLNDPGQYEGGELLMHGPGGAAQSVKLPAGSVVLYPGDTVHEVRPVTKGARLAAFFWVQSLVRCQVQRKLLYELDMNITNLRERLPDTPELTPLTGTYHNLLRMWSHT